VVARPDLVKMENEQLEKAITLLKQKDAFCELTTAETELKLA
jgi:hypothetical protein